MTALLVYVERLRQGTEMKRKRKGTVAKYKKEVTKHYIKNI